MPWWGICIIFMCSIIIISFRKVHTAVSSWQWYVSKRERDMPWGLSLFLGNPSIFYGLNISGSLAQNCWLSVLRNHSSWSYWQWTRPAFNSKVQHHLISLITFWTSNIVVTCFYSIYRNSWYFFFSDFFCESMVLFVYGTVPFDWLLCCKHCIPCFSVLIYLEIWLWFVLITDSCWMRIACSTQLCIFVNNRR